MITGDWKKVRLGEIAVFSQGVQVPVGEQSKFPFDGCVRFIRIVDFTKAGQEEFRYVANPGEKYIVKDDDLVMIRYGSQTAGKIARGFNGAIANNTFKISPDEKLISKQFLFNFLSQKEVHLHLMSSQVSTTMPAITFEQIGKLEVYVPPLKYQNLTSSIISSLDEKIELNRQTNQTLEAIAQALFKEWFVDFNFPDATGEMENSELGEIPKGWRIGKLQELLEVKYGKDHKHLEIGNIPVYGSGGIMRFANKSLYEYESILIPRKGTLSNLFYVNKPFWSVDTMFYSKIKLKNGGKYLFHLLLSLNLASMNVGSAVPSLTTEILNNIPVIIPAEEVLGKFEEVVTSLFNQKEQYEETNQSLIQVRDALLPKLMKGEIKL